MRERLRGEREPRRPRDAAVGAELVERPRRSAPGSRRRRPTRSSSRRPAPARGRRCRSVRSSSSKARPGGDRLAERVQVHDHQVERLDALLGELLRGAPACRVSARMPAWIAGCSVFTRPSSISGNPVTSATLVTSTPASRERARPCPRSTRLDAQLAQARGPARRCRSCRTTASSALRIGARAHGSSLVSHDPVVGSPDGPRSNARTARGSSRCSTSWTRTSSVSQSSSGLIATASCSTIGPCVDARIHQVHRDAGDLDAPRQRVGHRVRARERRQQRRMDVEPPIPPPTDDRRAEHPHVPGAHDHVDPSPGSALEGRYACGRRGLTRARAPPPGRPGRAPARGRTRRGRSGRTRATRVPPRGVVEQRLQVRPGAGHQHRDTPAHGCTHASRAASLQDKGGKLAAPTDRGGRS